jgi:hypothetical protein
MRRILGLVVLCGCMQGVAAASFLSSSQVQTWPDIHEYFVYNFVVTGPQSSTETRTQSPGYGINPTFPFTFTLGGLVIPEGEIIDYVYADVTNTGTASATFSVSCASSTGTCRGGSLTQRSDGDLDIDGIGSHLGPQYLQRFSGESALQVAQNGLTISGVARFIWLDPGGDIPGPSERASYTFVADEYYHPEVRAGFSVQTHSAIPEPGPLALLASGLVLIVLHRIGFRKRDHDI